MGHTHMSDSEIMNTLNDLVDELTLSDENDDPDSGEIDYPEDEEEEEEETDLDTSSMDMSDSSSNIENEENDSEEFPFPNLTIRIPTAEAESSHSPLYSPGTPETGGIPGDLAEDLAAEAHALETEEEAFSEEKIETTQEEKNSYS